MKPEPTTPTQKLKSILSAPKPPPYLLFLSPDLTRRERFIQRYKITFPGTVSVFQGKDFDKTTLKKMQDVLQSYSLFSQQETVILSDIDELNAGELKQLQETLLTESFPNTLIMLGTTLPATSVFLKYCLKHQACIQLSELKGLELKRWVTKEFETQGIKNVSDRVIDKIIELGHVHVDAISKKIEIAALYSNNGEITQDDLNILFHDFPEESEFILFDLAASGQRIKAELLLERLLQSGKSPFGLVAIWARTVGQLLTISLMQTQRAHDATIREALGIAPWLFTKIYPLVKKLSLTKLTLIQKRLLKVDGLLKNKSLGANELLISCLDTVYP